MFRCEDSSEDSLKFDSGYACISCYNTFGTGKKVKAEADPKQTAITQFFKKQKQ